MNTYRVWVRINNLQTAHVMINCDHDYQVRPLAEAMYGSGSVLGFSLVT